jgi:hypothetical protein
MVAAVVIGGLYCVLEAVNLLKLAISSDKARLLSGKTEKTLFFTCLAGQGDYIARVVVSPCFTVTHSVFL